MRTRFGDLARVVYLDTTRPEVQEQHGEMIATIKENGWIYPVTVIDGEPMYEGAVSYPGILRAIQSKIEQTT
ncbi:MAG: DUF1462 family protein [Coriobacteriia bacterium]|nr:DUF1462 family protein [Coriobacteriia bacterium]GAV32311.1 hypothetical protein emb_1c0706 [Coriobacteriaceae bacterium EMTCatB1]